MLKDKAIENLAAGELLLDHGHVNAAASRFYYAMYEAAVHRLTLYGHRPGKIRSGAVDWDHSMVENNVFMCRGDRRDRPLYTVMRRLRGQADYDDDAVDKLKLDERRDAIRDFVRELAR
jgi:uncharacterized protein (UPF0332 family)